MPEMSFICARLDNSEKQLSGYGLAVRVRCYSFPLASMEHPIPLFRTKDAKILELQPTFLVRVSSVIRCGVTTRSKVRTDWRFIVNNLQKCTRINCDRGEEEEEEEDRTWGDQGKRWLFGPLWRRSWHCLVAFILLQVRSTAC